MKVTLESTTQIVEINGVPARIWEGTSAGGIRVVAFITRIAVDRDADPTEFARELAECRVPAADVATLPRRLVL